jgi:hypothetical protein
MSIAFFYTLLININNFLKLFPAIRYNLVIFRQLSKSGQQNRKKIKRISTANEVH